MALNKDSNRLDGPYLTLILRFDAAGDFNQTSIPMTTYNHSFVQLGKYNDKPFITGSFESLDVNNNRTEYLMDDNGTLKWFEADAYPDATL